MIGIYKITSPSGKVYIGQSTNIELRFKHYKYLKSKKQIRLHNSFLKYGVENHLFEVLKECDENDLNSLERHYQDLYDVTSKKGLNCDLTSCNNSAGRRSQETKEKIRVAAMGNKNFLGRKHNPKSILLMKKNMKGRVVSQETRDIARKQNLGKIYSDERKKMMSETNGMARIVLDLQTGIFWRSVKEVSEIYNLNHNCLIQKLGKHKINNTQFIYA